MGRLVLVSQYGPLPPLEAELFDDPSVPSHLAKVIYTESRTGARVRRDRIIEKEGTVPPRTRNLAAAVKPAKSTPAKKNAPAKKAAPAAKAAPAKSASPRVHPSAVDIANGGPVELLAVDPIRLELGANVRIDPRVDDALVASIREHGVIEPITAYRDGDRLVVVHGQRRTAAAVQAGLSAVPVVVLAKPADVDRIPRQLAENDFRAGVSLAERVDAWQQLALLGVKPAQIAKRTGAKKEDVEQGLQVAASTRTRAVLDRAGDDDEPVLESKGLDLAKLAAIAEFDDDPEAQDRLIREANYYGFNHVVETLRQARAEASRRREVEPRLMPAGVRMADPDVLKGKDAADIAELVHDGQPLTPDSHASCPGHAAYVTWLHPQDWIEQFDPDAPSDENGWPMFRPPADGSVVVDGDAPGDDDDIDDRKVWHVVYVCTAFREHGHELEWEQNPTRWVGPTPSEVDSAHRDSEARADEEEAARRREWEEQAAAEREARRVEQERQAAWEASATVRRAWLRQHLKAKTLPADAAAFAAKTLAAGPARRFDNLAWTLAHELLGVAKPRFDERHQKWSRIPAAELVAKTPTKAMHVLYALALGQLEQLALLPSLRPADSTYTAVVSAYMLHLGKLGYELSEVEREFVGLHPADPGEDADA
jgi:ParB family chromosome partitioning protein